jgi:hypothetical protein
MRGHFMYFLKTSCFNKFMNLHPRVLRQVFQNTVRRAPKIQIKLLLCTSGPIFIIESLSKFYISCYMAQAYRGRV